MLEEAVEGDLEGECRGEEVDEDGKGNNLQIQLDTLTPITNKLGGFEFFEKVLNSPKYICAPMVDQSYIAFRALCRRYGTQLCYTPMMHSKIFATDAAYRSKHFVTDPQDRPLVVQFCANNPSYLLQAAKYVENQCDAVDINLGCPQNIAKSGNYGAFLMESPELVYQMVNVLHKYLSVPVFCKMRILRDIEQTVKFAKMLQDAGCQLLTVHGRTKEQKGRYQSLADWSAIKRVKEELSIPVIANGNIRELSDVMRCLQETKVDGVMSAEGLLKTPPLFSGRVVEACDISHEYLDICEKEYPTSYKYVRTHLLRMMKSRLEVYSDLRLSMSETRNIREARKVIEEVRERVLNNAPPVLTEDKIREERKEKKINKTEESWDNSIFAEA